MPTVKEVIQQLQNDFRFKDQIEQHLTLPALTARYGKWPTLHPSLSKALTSRGITQLYIHQTEAFETAQAGKSFVAVTPTASGKSLCYHLPVLQKIMMDRSARALYLFPTKALAQDQLMDLQKWVEASEESIYCSTYDGDTAPGIRTKVRKSGHIVLTNPDMLHSGILPHHTKWVSLFENLAYIVIDELHTYKGVFGTHVAHVLRRLQRICHYYGSNPQFICTSATIANPKQLAEQLTNSQMQLIEQNGAPAGEKHLLFYNPPVIHPTFGIRRSAVLEVRDLAAHLYKEKIQTIIFGKSRVRVEMIVTYLQQLTKHTIQDQTIMGYRGGYLPSERRKIEKGLRDGTIRTVVSTNALELGVDIGQLQACIMTGYPGNIASAWQQAGRAGRRGEDALIIYVAQSMPLDQYIMQHPDYLTNQQPEEGRIHPENVFILLDHLKCAAFELPFSKEDTYAEFEVQPYLSFLAEEQVLVATSTQWHWMTDRFPAGDVSLRSALQENVVIIDRTVPTQTKVIGEMDIFSALTLLHEEAIYMHQGIQHQVEKLDWEEKKAYVTAVDVDYFTDANLAVELKVLNEDAFQEEAGFRVSKGDLSILAIPTIFKKIRFDTHDNIGSGPIDLPEVEMHTTASWLSFDQIANWSEAQLTDVMTATAYAMESFLPLLVRSDRRDVHVVPQVKATHTQQPTFFVYDQYPGGVGLSEGIYSRWSLFLKTVRGAIETCPCQEGCPACIGVHDVAQPVKQLTIDLLNQLEVGVANVV